jgi:hypothetical protein
MTSQALLQPFQLLPLLSSFSFASNFISGPLTTDLFWNLDTSIIYFPSLASLNLANNSVTGALLHVLGTVSHPPHTHLHTWRVHSSTGTLPMLSSIDVSSNYFSGPIPSSFNSVALLLASNNSLQSDSSELPPFLEPRCNSACLSSCSSSSNSSSSLVASCLRLCCDVVQSTHSDIICPDVRFRSNHRKVARLDPSYSSFTTCAHPIPQNKTLIRF